MKKNLINNLIYFFSFFLLVTLVNKLFSFSYWPFYVGGLFGLFMPNLDHVLHIFVFKPFELTSQRVKLLINEKRYKEGFILLYDTMGERKDLIFHSVNFQIIFTILTFWVISSSSSLFGRGLVLGFYLSLVLFNLRKFLNKEVKEYFFILLVLLFIFGIMI
ncbi:MAG: hypothetical protein UR39_C0004G0043 [Candidatus Woesebacteria bacterium GW2011_GWA1_33_30]|uniref:Uncharacterized protein n=1 Tax=Candidatus Woesebacteria bacterium GW2011_GWA2_33_28 TaxID=1618561 RepID=A0A0G0CVR9_9BACT|nr:MAG: hypothetical protein UR38_C0004G0030 [Candidatus Woesebacteria bacterium GW2011_GWA2_33_28]KKP48422.1 MAG: hypothetical protein UR39_C0004G0043 [Candidatus Woesebacteria bacterium GW2011_GWA1_33_30]KKP49529.1 MAG: hypothetical protein UR40_C0005G0043 [Microgenomates group bacterium GW2011_GWC1_33_32]KKP52494.1 MAG: hypothetical protein UR44_C0002G0043 [Candidatus Woesebacteria bacterium GW2011_GWB1_33_38]KKP58352.1 MAG: hypothetical protein UR48_C0005G0030 [Microgenomates group bacteriu